jgi:hypothetical protein
VKTAHNFIRHKRAEKYIESVFGLAIGRRHCERANKHNDLEHALLSRGKN